MTDAPVPDDDWTTHGRRTVFDAGGVQVEAADLTAPAGDRFTHHVVHLRRVAIALVVDRDDRVLMLRTYRYAAGRHGWELPGGLVEDGEDPAVAAAREAAEETGWRPVGPGRALIAFEPLPGGVTAAMHVHLWHSVEHGDVPLDPHEPGRARWVPLDDVARLAGAGELLGSGTLVGLLYYLAQREGPVPPSS